MLDDIRLGLRVLVLREPETLLIEVGGRERDDLLVLLETLLLLLATKAPLNRRASVPGVAPVLLSNLLVQGIQLRLPLVLLHLD